jgi:hypothetical protein
VGTEELAEGAPAQPFGRRTGRVIARSALAELLDEESDDLGFGEGTDPGLESAQRSDRTGGIDHLEGSRNGGNEILNIDMTHQDESFRFKAGYDNLRVSCGVLNTPANLRPSRTVDRAGGMAGTGGECPACATRLSAPR